MFNFVLLFNLSHSGDQVQLAIGLCEKASEHNKSSRKGTTESPVPAVRITETLENQDIFNNPLCPVFECFCDSHSWHRTYCGTCATCRVHLTCL